MHNTLKAKVHSGNLMRGESIVIHRSLSQVALSCMNNNIELNEHTGEWFLQDS